MQTIFLSLVFVRIVQNGSKSMHIVNILLTVGLVFLISGITVLSLCALIASSKNEDDYSAKRLERGFRNQSQQD